MNKRDFVVALGTAIVMCVPMVIIAKHQAQVASLASTAFSWESIKVVATKVGEKRQFFDAPTSTLNNLECHVTTLNAGEMAHAPHMHPEEELTIVKEGTVEVLVNGEMKIVGAGSVVFQAANTLHSIKNVGSTKAVYHAIKWRSDKTLAATK